MACRGQNKRYAAIYDVVLNYIDTLPAGQNPTLQNILDYFANDQVLSFIPEQDIINALTQMRPDKIRNKIKSLQNRQEVLKRLKAANVEMQALVNKVSTIQDVQGANTPRNVIAELVPIIERYRAAVENADFVSPNKLASVFSRMNGISSALDSYFYRRFDESKNPNADPTSPTHSNKALAKLKQNIKELDNILLVGSIDTRNKLIQDRIDALSGTDPDPAALFYSDVSPSIDVFAQHPEMEELNRRQEALREEAQGITGIDNRLKKIGELINRQPPKRKQVKVPDVSDTQKEIDRLTEFLKELKQSVKIEGTVPLQKIRNLQDRIDAILETYPNLIDNGNFNDDAVKALTRAREAMREVQLVKKLERMQTSMDKLSNDMASLENRLINNFEEVLNIDLNQDSQAFIELNRQVAEKQNELQQLRAQFQERKRRLVNKESVKHFGKLSQYKLPRKIQEAWKNEAGNTYELFRTIQFMADLSFYGVQLSPVVTKDLMNIDIVGAWKKYADGGSLSDTVKALIPGWIRTAHIFNEAVAQVAADNVRNGSERALATQIYNSIQDSPYFQQAKAAGLKISEPGNVNQTEEMFRLEFRRKLSNLPVIRQVQSGFRGVKNLSEDTMVSTLNMYRMNMFQKFLEKHPTANKAEIKKIADYVNYMTGAKASRSAPRELSYILSAPNLLFSKVQQAAKLAPQMALSMGGFYALSSYAATLGLAAFTGPVGVAGAIAASYLAQKGTQLVENNAAKRFIAGQLGQTMRSYIAMYALTAAVVNAIGFEDEEEEKITEALFIDTNPYSKNFLRMAYKGYRMFDPTGGLGNMYRGVMRMASIIQGKGDPKKFIDLGTSSRDLWQVALETTISNRAMPTITLASGIATGRSFFGKPLDKFFGDTMGWYGKTPQTLEAIIRSFLPIPVQTGIDLAIDEYTGKADKFNSSPTEKSAFLMLTFLGINNYELPNFGSHLEVKAWEESQGRKRAPSTPYPYVGEDVRLTGKYFDPNDPLYQRLRDDYKEKFGNEYGLEVLDWINIDPDFKYGSDAYNEMMEGIKARVREQWLEENKDEIEELMKSDAVIPQETEE